MPTQPSRIANHSDPVLRLVLNTEPRTLNPLFLFVFIGAHLWLLLSPAFAADPLSLTLRSRVPLAPNSARSEVITKSVRWQPNQTAVIVCDVWDKHWCSSANSRLAALLPRMNQTLKALRDQGALIIHAPSDTLSFYESTPQRALAKSAPNAEPPAPLKGWNHLDRSVEAALPIDDSDGGCDCQPQCKQGTAWKRQHPAITIAPTDAISDSGPEIHNLLHSRNIKHVLILGVHTNMCVLGRPFGIRQLVRWSFDVALLRDLTDTMYNSRQPPNLPHHKGTDLVIEHVERYWCPSVHSSDILADAKPPHIVFAIGEDEYDAKSTLPDFAKEELEKTLGYKCTILQANKEKTDLPNLDALDSADLLVLYFRRTNLPADQLARFKTYFAAGKPLVALRTSCHGFQNWLEFDRQVLACRYTGHYGQGAATQVKPTPNATTDPLLRGLIPAEFPSQSWLYKLSPLAPAAIPLLLGQNKDNPPEPIAWLTTHNGARIFFTSLGHQADFQSPQFRRLLLNAIEWTLDRPIAK